MNIGQWLMRPMVAITGQKIPVADCGEICVGITNLRLENNDWLFEAVASCELGENDGERFYPGEISWLAFGWRQAEEEP